MLRRTNSYVAGIAARGTRDKGIWNYCKNGDERRISKITLLNRHSLFFPVEQKEYISLQKINSTWELTFLEGYDLSTVITQEIEFAFRLCCSWLRSLYAIWIFHDHWHGKKVSLSQSSIKKDAPNQCSSNNFPSINLYGIVAAALPKVLRYTTQFVTLFPPPSFVRAASVPCMPLRSFRPRYAPLHPFAARQFASSHGIPPHPCAAMHGGMHMPFAKPALQYSLGSIMLHFVLHSLQ